MLSLDQEIAPGVFADHVDPTVQHVVPDQLRLVDAEGSPDFELMLFRSATTGGGQLTARFQPLHSVRGAPSVPLARRQRIALRSLADDLDILLDWQTVFADPDDAVLFRHSLTADQASIATRLAQEGSSLFEITLEEDRAAMRGPQPWRVRGASEAFYDALAAFLPDGPVTAADVTIAVQSLPRDMLVWEKLGSDVSTPTDDLATAALASRILNLFFIPVANGYFLLGSRETGAIELRLDREWGEVLRTRLTWGFDQAPELVSPDAIARHFPRVDQTAPFKNAEIILINQLPLDSLSAQKLHVDLAYTGHQGTETNESFSYSPDDDPIQVHNIVLSEQARAFEMRSRSHVLLPPSDLQGFPVLWPQNASFVERGQTLTIGITPSDLDVQLRRIEVEETVFDLAQRITFRFRSDVYTSVVSLDADHHEAWIVLPSSSADYQMTVEAENGAAVQSILPMVNGDPTIVLAHDLVPDDPVSVSVSLAPDIVFAIVEWQDQAGTQPLKSQVVTPDDIPEMHFWPSSVFAPVALRWRSLVVRRASDGGTLPMTESDWLETSQSHFDIL